MKTSLTTTTSHTSTLNVSSQETSLSGTLHRLLLPLARLCLVNGVTFAAVAEILKRAFVQEAAAIQPGAPSHGAVSRISTVTGLNRREVTRLISPDKSVRPTKPPLASELFARWTTAPAYHDHNGAPRVLKRQGAAPSFESLAHSITRDVHPRSLLEELMRLGLVQHDQESDCVTLACSDFVPSADSRQILDFLGDNVGDHLDAAVANALSGERRHLEQAIFADELSAESIETLRPLVTAHWQALRDAMVPALTALIEADRLAGRRQDQRVRIGLYGFSGSTPDNEAPTTECSASPNHNNKRR